MGQAWFATQACLSGDSRPAECPRCVIHQRITRAVELITMNHRDIEGIASELGYRDVQFFTRQATCANADDEPIIQIMA